MEKCRIASRIEFCSETGERLYWHDADGWVSKDTANVFTLVEMYDQWLPYESYLELIKE